MTNSDKLKILFDYKYTDDLSKDKCDINTQPTVQSVALKNRINFVGYSIVGSMNLIRPDVRFLLKQIYTHIFVDDKEDRAIGALVGLVVGDAMGAPLEFKPLQYGKVFVTDMESLETDNRFGLKPGQWTDDTSMALCLCDSLIEKKGFDPIDTMLRYLNWWYNGYNNATMFDFTTQNHQSVGLGGNIGMSFDKFIQDGRPYTSAGDCKTSGNGSIMRLAPVAIANHSNLNKCLQVARASSYVTHRGIEAAECCALLSLIIVNGINTGDKSFINNLHNHFVSKVKSVNYLAASWAELDSNGVIDPDRDWRWKSPGFKYSPERSQKQPGYIGSYSMDGMAMALHCFYTTKNFVDCVLKAVNLCGDADSVGAIAGQIAGAYYGVSSIPQKWIDCFMRWDGGGTIAYRASLLYQLNKGK